MTYKSIKLNNSSYVHVEIRKNVQTLCDYLKIELLEDIKCINIDDNMYGFLIFKGEHYVIIFVPGSYYMFSSYNELNELSSACTELAKVILADIRFQCFDLSPYTGGKNK